MLRHAGRQGRLWRDFGEAIVDAVLTCLVRRDLEMRAGAARHLLISIFYLLGPLGHCVEFPVPSCAFRLDLLVPQFPPQEGPLILPVDLAVCRFANSVAVLDQISQLLDPALDFLLGHRRVPRLVIITIHYFANTAITKYKEVFVKY